ncbi:MAG: uracil phosphoribosyltransferase [Opitutales bacterium]|nr:uracil phosphoribosyltransferase [Opitutales bacterium]
MPKPLIVDHPLVHANFTKLRDRNTRPHEFRTLVRNLTTLLLYEAFREAATQEVKVQTPLAEAPGRILSKEISLVSILRAGLGMMDGFLDLLPFSSVGYIGLARNEDTLQPESYYCKLPERIASTQVALVDPMLATGGSAVAAVEVLEQAGVEDITFIGLLAAPEGLEKLTSCKPRVRVILGAIDDRLDSRGYIVPGLGDAGDRLFGTE